MLNILTASVLYGIKALNNECEDPNEANVSKIRSLVLSTPTMFVVLPVYNYNEGCKTVINLLSNANEPSKIVVGMVCSPNQTSKERIDSSGFPSNVKAIVNESTFDIGPQAIRQICMKTLYANEPYVFFTHAHSKFEKGWDATLYNSIKGYDLVSQIPFEIRASEKVSSEVATFPVLEPDETLSKGLPVFRARAYARPNHQNLLPCVSCKALFGRKATMKKLSSYVVPFVNSEEDDFIMSNLCYFNNYKACNPKTNVLFHISQIRKHPEDDYSVSKSFTQYRKSVLVELLGGPRPETRPKILADIQNLDENTHRYVDSLGIDVKNKKITGRLILGLADRYVTEHDIISKYGSFQRFNELKAMFCFE
jgi:hypothetical protein